jgi:hypothetical protein
MVSPHCGLWILIKISEENRVRTFLKRNKKAEENEEIPAENLRRFGE